MLEPEREDKAPPFLYALAAQWHSIQQHLGDCDRKGKQEADLKSNVFPKSTEFIHFCLEKQKS